MPPSATTRRQHQVLVDGQPREDAALLRHEAEAGAGDPVQRQPHQVLAARSGRCRSRLRDSPMMARKRRGLADAVAAEQRDGLALADLEVDAVQHMALAVPGVEPRDFESSG